MKFIIILSLFISITFNFTAQGSFFYGYFPSVEATLVPLEANESINKTDKIVPNFKGRELVQLDYIPQHYPDRKWQQHEYYTKSTSTSVIWQTHFYLDQGL